MDLVSTVIHLWRGVVCDGSGCFFYISVSFYLMELVLILFQITFAKIHMDHVPAQLEAVRDKMNFFWTEINKTEQDADAVSNDQQLQHIDVDMETRLIATARHMTLRFKKIMAALYTGSSAILPITLTQKLEEAKKFSEQLYTDFMQVEFGFFIKIRIQKALALYYLHDRVFINIKHMPGEGVEICVIEAYLDDE